MQREDNLSRTMLKGFDQPREVPKRPESSGEFAHESMNQQRRRKEDAVFPGPQKRRVPNAAEANRGQKVPYLNVVTNFSKPHPSSQHAPTMSIHRRKESLQERRRKGKLNGGSNSRIQNLKEESEWGLSPSDRELMIGISIPGPPTGQPEETSSYLKPTDRPRQPAIVISSVDAHDTKRLQPRGRGRATSSIYSHFPDANGATSTAPPVPRLPRHSVATSIATSSRCTSWASDFSEDDTLQHSRPESCNSQRPIFDRKSIDTIATKHRSRGWWNQILSPFLERPELPSEIRLEQDADHSYDDAYAGIWKLERKGTHESIWADLTGTHAARDTDKFFFKNDDPSFNNYPGVHRGDTVESPAPLDEGAGNQPQSKSFDEVQLGRDRSLQFLCSQDMGLAAEYYAAYWHDQNHPEPYFQCENHTCSYGNQAGPNGNKGLAEATGIGEGSRGLGNLPQGQKAKLGHLRPLSDATIIEEDLGNEQLEGSRQRRSNDSKTPNTRLPAMAAEPSSPEAMTPRLRRDFAQKRALPLEPTPNQTMPADQLAPRYPSNDCSKSETWPAPAPQPISAFSPPTPQAYQRRETNSQANTERALPAPPPVVHIHPHVGTSNECGGTHEINDARTWTFPPPPGAPDTLKESGEVEQAKAKQPKKAGLLKRIFGADQSKTKDFKKRRRLFCSILLGLLLMVVLIVVLVIELTLPRTDMPAQTSWLNITGFPPVPTGIATIIRPGIQAVDGCIEPPTMWSCALPKEQQASVQPNPADRPNFRVEIRFQNGTNLTSNSSNSKRSDAANRLRAINVLSRWVFEARDTFTSGLFTPSPAPPSNEDQSFLGNTTDHNHVPFAGEATPFYMSILNANSIGNVTQRLLRRQSNSDGNTTNSTNPFPNLGNDIPPPSINSDGTAAAANLYPFPTAQPLLLYNRGLDTEHLGFYSYFDRSIFLKSASLANISTLGVVPDDENGGSTEAEASLRCTWAQTRFLVQIWTNSRGSLPLPSSNSTSISNSADDFTPPGSFPYPISITMDRHGGDINSKSIYCYGVNDRQQIVNDQKQFQIENRAFNGHLVNPAQGLFNQINVSLADGGPGGIDGGSGGCACLWRNFNSD